MPFHFFFIVLQVIGALIPFVGAIMLVIKKQNRGSMLLLMTCIGALIMNAEYLQLVLVNSPEIAVSLMKIQYVGNILFYHSFVMFVLNYYNSAPRKISVIPFGCWILIDLGALVAIWVDQFNRFMFEDIHFVMDDRFEVMHAVTTMGTLYMIRNSALCLILSGILIFSLCKALRVRVRSERRNGLYLTGTILIITSSLVYSMLRVQRFDIVPISASACVLFIILAVLRGGLFSTTEIANAWLYRNSNTMTLYTDSMLGFLEASPSMFEAFPELIGVARNERVPDRVMALLYEDVLSEHIGNVVEIDGRFYDRKRTAIVKEGERIGYALLLQDVTSQHSLMEQLEDARERADEANEAKSSFLSNMSHEIRTPMNAIVGMTEILMRSELTGQQAEYLANIKNSGDALLNIINDILDFSKIESGKLEIVEEEYAPMSLYHDLAMIFLNRIGSKPIELIYDISPQMPHLLYGDALRLRQVIINIMNNAIKFTDEGSVTLSVQVNEMEDGEAELSFRVTDTGQGIREEDLGKLFGSFSQVDSVKNHSKEGTGLGLAISKQLVERMGGHIGVESEYGKGSTFCFTVRQKVVDESPATFIKTRNIAGIGGRMHAPQAQQALEKLVEAYGMHWIPGYMKEEEVCHYFFTDIPQEISEEEQRLFREWGTELVVLQNPMVDNLAGHYDTVVNKPLFSLNFCQTINHESYALGTSEDNNLFTAPEARILIVDDNEMNLKVAIGMLEPLRLQIDTAENGKKAMEAIMANRYDVVFMDHMMPVMDGVEATMRLRAMEDEYLKTVPIVALTANAVAEIREQYFKAGMNDFVAKPIKMKDIVKVLRKWLPDEKIQELTPADIQTMEDMSSPVDTELPVIEGLDVAAGVEACGSVTMYKEMLADFYKLTELKITKLDRCLADNLIRDYTIEVHALKNTARMIGDMELSARFLRAEQLGNAEDIETIRAEHADLMARYRSMKPILKPFAVHNDAALTQASTEEIAAILDHIKECMDGFDLDGADAAMKSLVSIALPEAIAEDANRLAALLADVAIEEVMALCDDMKNRLE